MRRLVQDLHFGRDRPELLEALRQAFNRLGPDPIVMSDDLTQGATDLKFAAADFIQGLTSPVITIPGNHDLPLHNLFLRIFLLWSRYRRWITADLEPKFSDDEIVEIGVNTVIWFAWQQDWLSTRVIGKICTELARISAQRTRVVVVRPRWST